MTEFIRPTQAIIDLDAVIHNVKEIRRRIGDQVHLMGVVKADAYGHGAVEVGKTALKHGADSLAVGIAEEGKALREAGVTAPVLCFGAFLPEEAFKSIEANLEQSISSLEMAQSLDKAARDAGVVADVHIKVDTGMGRLGVLPEDVKAFAQKVSAMPNLNIKAVFSHFSTSGEPDPAHARHQIESFGEVVRELDQAGIHIPLKHLANSAGILNFPESFFNMVRAGSLLYGVHPSPTSNRCVELKPAMTLKTNIVLIQKRPAQFPISYNRTFYTTRETTLAVLPLGFADGYDRRFSNRGYVSIKGQRAPLVGRVCMDMVMVDVSDIKDVQVGDEAVFFGEEPTLTDLAEILGTIEDEIGCSISKRVPRIYVGGDTQS